MPRLLACTGCGCLLTGFQPVRFARSKPWHPRFKIIRHLKIHENSAAIRNRPSAWFENEFGDVKTMPEKLELMRKHHQVSHLPFSVSLFLNNSSYKIFEPVDPDKPEEGWIGKLNPLKYVSKDEKEKKKPESSAKEARKILQDNNVNTDEVQLASDFQNDYISVNEMLQDLTSNAEELLENYTTPSGFEAMTGDILNRSYRWELVSEVERPKLVKFSTAPMSGDNKFVQATVRVHLNQRRAIFDRFGRLILGSWSNPRELVEFLVFEIDAAAESHQWLLHGRFQSAQSGLRLIPTFRAEAE